jgi:hypothetical protein
MESKKDCLKHPTIWKIISCDEQQGIDVHEDFLSGLIVRCFKVGLRVRMSKICARDDQPCSIYHIKLDTVSYNGMSRHFE